MIINGEAKALHASLKEIVRISVIIMYLTGWRDTQFMRSAMAAINIVDDPALAYGYAETLIKQFSPREISQRDVVDSWLNWLRRQDNGVRQVVRIEKWARGDALWKIAQHENVSKRTIINRIDRSIDLILNMLTGIQVGINPILEQLEQHPLAFMLEKPASGYAGERTQFGKAFVHGTGFVRNGKPLRDGRHKAEDKRLHRERA